MRIINLSTVSVEYLSVVYNELLIRNGSLFTPSDAMYDGAFPSVWILCKLRKFTLVYSYKKV